MIIEFIRVRLVITVRKVANQSLVHVCHTEILSGEKTFPIVSLVPPGSGVTRKVSQTTRSVHAQLENIVRRDKNPYGVLPVADV